MVDLERPLSLDFLFSCNDCTGTTAKQPNPLILYLGPSPDSVYGDGNVKVTIGLYLGIVIVVIV